MTIPLPTPPGDAAAALGHCMAETGQLIHQHRMHLPHDNINCQIPFADGSVARVYRETVVDVQAFVEPVTLIVGFRLRGVAGNGLAHAAFRRESLLNTTLFVGFPGFVSKLWLAHDNHNLYRGVYDWDGYDNAESYVRTLWWPLLVVSQRDSIRYQIIAGADRDATLLTRRQSRTIGSGGAPITRDEGLWPRDMCSRQ
ncbi:hypothetical protein KXR83_16310 [Williamsia muralis]|uniref:Uncharacterized protein n=1 Tax=Williamsia marianensis TaxID=85044 RepID=A0ABU4F151_WILMA|nr:hypothetical protein [Williamsia muralis]MDV7136604.1 hypothetical protein [Williamsia muralis]